MKLYKKTKRNNIGKPKRILSDLKWNHTNEYRTDFNKWPFLSYPTTYNDHNRLKAYIRTYFSCTNKKMLIPTLNIKIKMDSQPTSRILYRSRLVLARNISSNYQHIQQPNGAFPGKRMDDSWSESSSDTTILTHCTQHQTCLSFTLTSWIFS